MFSVKILYQHQFTAGAVQLVKRYPLLVRRKTDFRTNWAGHPSDGLDRTCSEIEELEALIAGINEIDTTLRRSKMRLGDRTRNISSGDSNDTVVSEGRLSPASSARA